MLRITLLSALLIFQISAGAVTSAELDLTYQNVRRFFEQVYGPIVQKEAGLEFEIRLDEEAPDFFGGMAIENEKLVISLGSRAHFDPTVTPDAYFAILCHEVGHRLGGPPFKDQAGSRSWSSHEGQSDYYAASVCLKKIYSADPQTQKMSYPEIPDVLRQRCRDLGLKDLNQEKICLRIIKAGQEMAEQVHSIYLAFPNPPKKPNLLTPEAPGKSFGFLYPSIQCRLDTFVQGALDQPRPDCWYSR